MSPNIRPLEVARSLVDRVIKASRLDTATRDAVLAYASSYGSLSGCVVIAFGKGAVSMVKGLLDAGVEPSGGIVVIPRGSSARGFSGLEVLEASHPVPDESSLRAGEAVIEWARSSRGSCSVFLVSGGGSSLVEKPVESLGLGDLVEATRLLINSGASIIEVNTVRKHLSEVKGGRLAEVAYPSRLAGFYASDVPGDRIDAIASGPTVPDPTTYSDAINVLELYGLTESVPESVLKVLEEGSQGLRPETPKPGSEVFKRAFNKVIARNIDVLEHLREVLEEWGYRVLVLTSRLEGESRHVGYVLASLTMESLERGYPLEPPAAILAGGETTVTVRGKGRGGRNMELALAWGIYLSGWGVSDEAAILAMDTDGIDGFTEYAGAVLEPRMIREARLRGVDPAQELANNNSLHVLEKVGALVKTGPTGSNLNSVIAVIVGSPG
ncbi:MAG: glycerate kinase [Desulfurococcales archaeon]|nr:glycerate kinase [Desulfurococcales archaeon]